ncbi:MAG: DUF2624 domain-containing protein [Bacillota bacterium]|uniref:DUF2624 domain-containing protein n=1 Tax=Virgibacillus salarius TaxID=447199 RepID=A0A941IC21_9BACI|nr:MULTISPECIES: DUF2624 domain-containing protein [Bacillaceae]NAZ09721.1 DUF2624 family protein [Agaribacter marinus]MBR7797011.1 DUF2624 domain-containing protein [Virgibacillus salarius]MCC2251014.1 DUF2624 domain-containing protein [Virgibacillus sp. AGTR]MDY7042746.1 DUF2624 domain-containing protein [Virgibacillus sp. M23]QRZ17432.1 DUF2624 domain-containing protein [Virgibacillus sp. AGTR]
MSNFIKEMIRRKLAQLTAPELLHYSNQYGFSLSNNEAQQIITYLKKNNVDPFSSHGREKMLRDLALITDQATAKKAQKLFNELIKSYGLGHLFE